MTEHNLHTDQTQPHPVMIIYSHYTPIGHIDTILRLQNVQDNKHKGMQLCINYHYRGEITTHLVGKETGKLQKIKVSDAKRVLRDQTSFLQAEGWWRIVL